jgi:hypothetical protein
VWYGEFDEMAERKESERVFFQAAYAGVRAQQNCFLLLGIRLDYISLWGFLLFSFSFRSLKSLRRDFCSFGHFWDINVEYLEYKVKKQNRATQNRIGK